LSFINDLIRRSAKQWDVSPRLATWLFWIAPVGAIAMVLLRIDKDLFRLMLGEDGPVEWVQFSLFAAAFVAAGTVTMLLRADRRWLQAGLYAVATVGLFFIAGEEISWGQRVVGWETPAELAAINKQNETTLHNIGKTLLVMNSVMMLVGMWGVFAYPLKDRLRLDRLFAGAERLLVPPFFLAGAFAVIGLYKLVRFTIWIPSGFTITKYGEWAELSLAFGICAFAVLNVRRLSAEARTRRARARMASVDGELTA